MSLDLKKQYRGKVLGLEDEIRNSDNQCTEKDFPLIHHFARGLYAREMFHPAGVVVVAKIQKYSHFNFIKKGKVMVAMESGNQIFEAPCLFASKPGAKRAVYALEDTIWITIHATEKTDLEEIEEELIAKSFEEFDKL